MKNNNFIVHLKSLLKLESNIHGKGDIKFY